MGLAQSLGPIAVAEAHALALGLFSHSSQVQPSTKRNKKEEEVIIIPIDYSSHSESAFEWYVKHMHKENNVVRLVYCQEVNAQQNVKDASVEGSIKRARNTGKSVIEKYEEKLQKYQIAGSVHCEYASSPGEFIIFSVDRYRGTQIVMGSRGLGVIKRSLLGSVSHYVLDHTHVPVTIIPRETRY